MFVEIISAFGAFTTTLLGLQVTKNTTKKPLVIIRKPSTNPLENLRLPVPDSIWLLENPYSPTMEWVNKLQAYFISKGRPLTAEEYLTYRSIIMTIQYVKDHPVNYLLWFNDYMKWAQTNGLKPVAFGVQNDALYNWVKKAVLVAVGLIIPLALPAVVTNIATKYQNGTLSIEDLKALQCPTGKIKDATGKCVCPTGQTEDATGKCVYNFGG